MGKNKPIEKAGPTLTQTEANKKIKKESTKQEENFEDKKDLPKDGGVKPAKKGQKSEIDDIFSAGKKKVLEGKRPATDAACQESDAAAVAAAAAAPAKRPRVEGSKDDIFGEAAGKGRSRTEEGYAIYTEEELGLGKKGGDTDLCPFDCDCCF
ncbi:hypothetical protein VOLCADRAFT_103551 [Volvox carteri f. nagariensis]|uniref:DUF1764-domain-containing protein n=1 Tax=Volvox carteri f. nagariensis TaxID=3068 RepID=D8TMQ5_VOLCA|nr:uncharacterized protein VOLCADRAFT_103551 [Volvox carteri f. nagariensis]EFJ51167.1 hypothetical protein VOLCADRAFT_103551 [Volvox carteri f. nagariensis]|eukprot:XP_002947634.1 hypothetical protein VOLCADRAFT_103551 [Volvox carteri f. nagariensis]